MIFILFNRTLYALLFTLILSKWCLAFTSSIILQNYTVDNLDFSWISYANVDKWRHSSPTGREAKLDNVSLSHTQTPGSTASLTFTGCGIRLLGPFTPDQAQRRVYLDGKDMGAFTANSQIYEKPRPFWGADDLVYTTHTVIVVHNDSEQMTLSIDAWIVEMNSLLPSPPLPKSVPRDRNFDHKTGQTNTTAHMVNAESTNNSSNRRAIILSTVVTSFFVFLLCVSGLFVALRHRMHRSHLEATDPAGMCSFPPKEESLFHPTEMQTTHYSGIGVRAGSSETPKSTFHCGSSTYVADKASPKTAADTPDTSVSVNYSIPNLDSTPESLNGDSLPENGRIAAVAKVRGRSRNANRETRINTNVDRQRSDVRYNPLQPHIMRYANNGAPLFPSGDPSSTEYSGLPSRPQATVSKSSGPPFHASSEWASSLSHGGYEDRSRYRAGSNIDARDWSHLYPIWRMGNLGIGNVPPNALWEDFEGFPLTTSGASNEGWPNEHGPARLPSTSNDAYIQHGTHGGDFHHSLNPLSSHQLETLAAQEVPSWQTTSHTTSATPTTAIPLHSAFPSRLAEERLNNAFDYHEDRRPQGLIVNLPLDSLVVRPIVASTFQASNTLRIDTISEPDLLSVSKRYSTVYPQQMICGDSEGIPSVAASQRESIVLPLHPRMNEEHQLASEALQQEAYQKPYSTGIPEIMDSLSPFESSLYEGSSKYTSSATPSSLACLTPLSNPPFSSTGSYLNEPYLPSHLLSNLPFYSSQETLGQISGTYDTGDNNSSTQPARAAILRSELTKQAFMVGSYYPNGALAKLWKLINESHFVKTHGAEPPMSSNEGRALLAEINYFLDCPAIPLDTSNRSIFSLLVDLPSHKCLVCGSTKTSAERAINCVRIHLNHRHFVCSGCPSCNKKAEPVRFCTSELLNDHLRRQKKSEICPNCNKSILQGGMKRHWKAMHRDHPFPVDKFPGYGKRKKAILLSVGP